MPIDYMQYLSKYKIALEKDPKLSLYRWYNTNKQPGWPVYQSMIDAAKREGIYRMPADPSYKTVTEQKLEKAAKPVEAKQEPTEPEDNPEDGNQLIKDRIKGLPDPEPTSTQAPPPVTPEPAKEAEEPKNPGNSDGKTMLVLYLAGGLGIGAIIYYLYTRKGGTKPNEQPAAEQPRPAIRTIDDF